MLRVGENGLSQYFNVYIESPLMWGTVEGVEVWLRRLLQ